MIGSVVTFLFVGLVAIVGLSIALALIGFLFQVGFALAGFLLFKVAPVVLLGYVIVRFLTPRHKRLARAERRWLEDD